MIKSMTGFASLTREGERASVTVTARGVNHRFLDLQMRMPGALSPIESRLRAIVQQRIARGRLEVTIAVQPRASAPAVKIEVNDAVVEGLSSALDRARERGLISGGLTPGDLLRFPQAITVTEQKDTVDEEAFSEVEAALATALDGLDRMRTSEGAHLQSDLEARRVLLGDLFSRAAAAAQAGADGMRARLAERIKELRVDPSVDEAAIAQELVRFANRSDVTEETVRFRAHLEHWRALSEGPEPCGRKLDFLLQEMNREVNTLGSKAEGQGVTELVVGLKAELEKMREQVQNVE
ncbi:MAG TPA: YicC/YloC family endoribonuclease [Vicinamibacterales bacterium]|jgi:uncharacterized protein (TIGR00255 family)